MPDNNRILAVDAGFSHTKLFSPIDDISISFPSAVAEPLPSMEGFGGGQKVYVTDHGKYVFGDCALKPGSKLIHSMDDSWLLKHIPGLICAAAGKAGISLHDVDTLSTGLPVVAWRQHKDQLKEALRTIRCNGETYIFSKVEVRPQAVGALGLYSKAAPDYERNGLILDIGGNTVLAVAWEDMRPIATNTKQYNHLGILSIGQAIMPLLSQISDGAKINEIRAMQAVREKRFRQTDITTQVNSAISAYSERLLQEIRADYRDIIPELDRLIICGGGAYTVGEALKREYPRVTILDQPEYANVRGYAYLSTLSAPAQA